MTGDQPPDHAHHHHAHHRPNSAPRYTPVQRGLRDSLRDFALFYRGVIHLTEAPHQGFMRRNELLHTKGEVTFGDPGNLGYHPLDFPAREVPDDPLLVVERDGRRYFDAAAATVAAAWSVAFGVGLGMYETYSSVKDLILAGIVGRAKHFRRGLPADQVCAGSTGPCRRRIPTSSTSAMNGRRRGVVISP